MLYKVFLLMPYWAETKLKPKYFSILRFVKFSSFHLWKQLLVHLAFCYILSWQPWWVWQTCRKWFLKWVYKCEFLKTFCRPQIHHVECCTSRHFTTLNIQNTAQVFFIICLNSFTVALTISSYMWDKNLHHKKDKNEKLLYTQLVKRGTYKQCCPSDCSWPSLIWCNSALCCWKYDAKYIVFSLTLRWFRLKNWSVKGETWCKV